MSNLTWIGGGAALVVALSAATWSITQPRATAAPAATEKAMSNVIHLNTEAFPKLIAQSKPVIIDFWAPWCGPCRTQGPILDQVSLLVGDRAIVAKVNVDEERQLAAQFGVSSIPTLVVLKDGKVIKQFVGVQQAETLVRAIETPAS
jgi:thioredoxin 1